MGLRKSIVFTLDASFALLVVVSTIPVLLLISSQPVPTHHTTEYLHFLAEDSVDVVALVKISDVRNEPAIDDLFQRGVLQDSDLNASLLNAIGLFWSANNPSNLSDAHNVTQQLLSPFLPANMGWELQIGGDVIYNTTDRINASILTTTVSRRAASGFSRTAPLTGIVARAYLENIIGTDLASYFFFGGFVGQGNITATIHDLPSDANVSKIYMELNGGADFDFYVNNVFCQSMSVSPGNFTVDNWTITAPACLDDIVSSGVNNFSLNFSSGSNFTDQFVGGGFLKLVYSTQELYSDSDNVLYYHFPGIHGLVNLYDSFYVPGNITTMNANVTFFTGHNYSTVLMIGNTTVLNHTGTNSSQTIRIQNSDFQQNFSDHNVTFIDLSNTTIPLRMLVSANLTGGLINGTVDIALITDLSGSMNWRLDQDGVGGNSITNCSDPDLFLSSTSRISLARCLDKWFINAVLGGNESVCTGGTPTPGNNVGLVGFSTQANNWESLTDDIGYLTSQVDLYSAGGGTCVSCAINRAYEILASESGPNRSKYIVVMTDGVANYRSTPSCNYMNDADLDLAVADSGGFALRHPPWSPETTGQTTTDLNHVSALNRTLARAVGDAGEIYYWNGTAWLLEQDLGTLNIFGVDMFNETLAFSGGDSSRIWRWDGSNWAQDADFGSNDVLAIAFQNSSWAWAVGQSNKIWAWDGTGWYEFQDMGSGTLYGVATYGNTNALAVGSSGKIYRWLGGAWSEEEDTGSNTHRDAAILDANTAFSVTTNNRIYEWDGSSWSQAVNTGAALYGIHLVNSSMAYAVGDYDVWEWDGTTWARTYAPVYYHGNLTTGIYCSDDDSCSLSVSDSWPALNANYSSYRAFRDLINVTVDSVGFGPISSCNLGNDTVTQIALAGNGSSYSSSNASELQTIYCQIVENILTSVTTTQQVMTQGNLTDSILDPSSYIKIVYDPDIPPPAYQEITLNAETAAFPGCDGSFLIPPGMTITDAKLTSYSGFYWTKGAYLQSSLTGGGWQNIFNLSVHGPNYTDLGDPYHVYLPINLLAPNETNQIRDELGFNVSHVNPTCSDRNRVIYNLRLRAYAPFEGVFEEMNGSNVTVYYDTDHDGIEDGFVYVAIGAGLPGFNATPILVEDLDPINNALHDSLLRLLDQINFVITGANFGRSGSENNPVDVILSSNVRVETDVLTFIPYIWGPVDISMVVWT
ncbi:VWA domain-containing protein [Candidatus Micrarchaeota archaeon]|nr:VWA domain-containing protein [Candidatus Micrarchaeota archaeon]